MKKTIYYMSLFIGLFICSSVLTACGDDDDDNGGSGGKKDDSDMRIIKRHFINAYDEMGDYYYSYDEQGRVAEIYNYDIYTGNNEDYERSTTYTYSNSVIKKTYSDSHQKWTYHLLDGRIISEDSYNDKTEYKYDKDGYLQSVKEVYDDDESERTLTWSNGNLTKITYKSKTYTDTITMFYSNIPWPKHWFCSEYDILDWDVNLIPQGAYGKMPKYLPSKIESRFFNHTETYEYEVRDGNVVSMVTRIPDEPDRIGLDEYTWGNYKVK